MCSEVLLLLDLIILLKQLRCFKCVTDDIGRNGIPESYWNIHSLPLNVCKYCYTSSIFIRSFMLYITV